ncbi:MAG TPA: YdjY domain-containing protein [Phycisphaerae bacterium]|nr:YdjY domain-containing protein [Phycisphaerae bacterium]
MTRLAVSGLGLLAAFTLGGCAAQGTRLHEALLIDEARCEVRLAAVIQKTDAPRMTDWGQATAALLGAREGTKANYFVFLTDIGVKQVHDALRQLGAQSRVVYQKSQVAEHKGIRPDNTPGDYLQGDPVQIFIEWKDGDRRRRRAYEDFFLEQTAVSGTETVKPWTPHFIFHGSGVLNNVPTGCLACTHDCPGGIIGNNQYPVAEPIPVLRADWSKLPAPGTRVTVVIRPVPSGSP